MKNFTALLLFIFGFGIIQAQHTNTIYLSGKGPDEGVMWDFMVTDGMRAGIWTEIEVPSCWELEGFGNYNYGLDENKSVEKGHYKKKLSVPETWEGKQVNIVFEGAMTDAEVKINGSAAGPVHKGAFYRFSYDISELLRYGSDDNIVEVIVSKMSSNPTINSAERKADYWVFGGIFRPVYLQVKPMGSIKWTAVDAKADGSFLSKVYFEKLNEEARVTGQIKSLDGKNVGSPFSVKVPKGTDQVTLTTNIQDYKTWTPESPNLYLVEYTLTIQDAPRHVYNHRFGFRTIELRRYDGVYLNGQKIHLKGVNRHSFYPSSGRTTSKNMSIEDVTLMKEMNMNAVRMSHYPPDVHFLDVCDSLGLLVLDELAGWQRPEYDVETAKRLIKQMVMRDVNHPSIIFWDNGNEGGWNYEADDDFAKYDPQNRNVIHPWEIFRGIDTQHYRSYGYGVSTFFYGDEVFFPTEILHGLYDGGHGAGLEDYWNLITQNPAGSGAFLWCFIDEAVVRTDKNGVLDTDGNHAPDGILGPYREKEGSFYAIKEIWSPVKMNMKRISPAFSGRISLENRYFFTNLNECRFEWKLVTFHLPNEQIGTDKIFAKGIAKAESIEPGQKGSIDLNLPISWKDADALYVKAVDPHGKEIYTWTWPIKLPSDISSRIVPEKASGAVSASDNKIFLTVKAGDNEFTFDKTTGLLNSVKHKDELISFSTGPLLAHVDQKFKELKHNKVNDTYVIEIMYEKGFDNMKWTFRGDGWVQLDYDYRTRGTFKYMGVSFSYPEKNVKSVTYLGDGPYRVWKNRLSGAELGVWQKDYNNTITGESWDYPEFKGYHSGFYWGRIETTQVPITIVSATEKIYLRLYTPGTPKADPRYTQVEFPTGDISFMHAINPIGTKFKSIENLGPQSQDNSYNGSVRKSKPLSGNFYLYFGD